METPPELSQLAQITPGQGGLPRYEIRTSLGEAHIYLHGAHVTHFATAGQAPLLFMSAKSHFETGKPIRGGVPVCFPWFGARAGDPSAPAHGFARLRTWTPESLVLQPDGAVTLTLMLAPDAESRALWPEGGDWVLRHRITVGATLTMELEIENRGTAAIQCEEALHTYFQVGDIHNVQVRGLENTEYYDKADGLRRKRQDDQPIRFVAETDRAYLDTAAACNIEDPGLQRRITVQKTASNSTIVWNPWIAKAKAMPDYGDEEWPGMVCVESGNVGDDALSVAPGARHTTRTVLSVQTL